MISGRTPREWDENMKFIGRSAELSALDRMYGKNSFEMMILYGRRRVGKTTLLNQFAEGKNVLFYTGVESKDSENLIEFGRAVFSHFSNVNAAGIEFRSYQDVLAYITDSVKRDTSGKREVIIIDEYPYIAENAPELASLLQREIDREWKDLNIMLILCGSSIAFMEEEVLDQKSPLYGRRTGQIDLQPFDYLTSAEFVPDYTPEEKAIAYGITGGIPRYLSLLDPEKTLEENILALYFDASGYLYEEPKNMLRQEFRDISLYFAILGAIGSGSTQLSEISDKTGFDSAKTAQAVKKLEAVRIIRKDVPILNEKNRKLNQYIIQDGMFRFWFRFVAKGTGAIERTYGNEYYAAMVKPYIHEFMGPVFETICQEYTFRTGVTGKYGSPITRIGKWRGADPVLKCPSDIDVVGINEADKTAVIGECKFRNRSFGKEECEILMDRARLLAPYRIEKYLMFSLGGYSDWVVEYAQNDSTVVLVSIGSLYSGAF